MLVFWIVFLATVITLEVMVRRGFTDTSLVKLHFMDNVLALLPGILIATIVVSLLLSSMGYSTQGSWGGALGFLRTMVYQGYYNAASRPLLSQFLAVYLKLHSLWLPVPTPLLAFGLP